MDIRNFRLVVLDKSEDTHNVVMYTYDKINVCDLLATNNMVLKPCRYNLFKLF